MSSTSIGLGAVSAYEREPNRCAARRTIMKRIALLVVALLVAGSACGSDEPDSEVGSSETSTTVSSGSTVSNTQPTPSSTELTVTRAASVGEPQQDLSAGHVRLWVSNQSFEDDPVAITIRIDGVVVVDDSFAVEGQHNWIAFDIAGLPPGDHSLVAESETGALTKGSFTLPAGESRWLVADYWYYPEQLEGRYFTLSESDEPVAFA